MTLPPAVVGELQFIAPAGQNSAPVDMLVFRNGDRLPGQLAAGKAEGKLLWRTDSVAEPVELATEGLAGLQFAPRAEASTHRNNCTARFRNGDWLAGRFVSLDREQLVLDTADAGQIVIARTQVKGLYFSAEGVTPVSDGASDREAWEASFQLSPGSVPARAENGTAATVELFRPGLFASEGERG